MPKARKAELFDTTIACTEALLLHPDAAKEEIQVYGDIPCRNAFVPTDMQMALRGKKIERFTVLLPRTGDDSRVIIRTTDLDLPGRQYTFVESGNSFLIEDSFAEAAPGLQREIALTVSKNIVASFLLSQVLKAKIGPDDRRILKETDPVVYGCSLLPTIASDESEQFTVESATLQIGPAVSVNCEKITQLDNDPLVLPRMSVYSFWITQQHEINGGVATERDIVTFSPENPLHLDDICRARSPLHR